MSNLNIKTPDFLQLKGYKYRAKILLAALVIVGILLFIVISIVNSISSAVRGQNRNKDNSSSNSTESSVVSQFDSSSDVESANDSDIVSSSLDTTQSELVSSQVQLKDEMDFDADGKLIINNDKFGGKKAVALTFDDGPGEYTAQLINELNKRNAKATFFMLGSCVEKYPEVLPKMVEGGHELGNHTYNHTDITTLSAKEINNQIQKTDDAIYNACGQYSTAFRPPYGSYNKNTNKTISDKIITLWSLDTVDWKLKDTSSVKDTIVSQCKDGDIILMHDIHKTTVEGVVLAIDELMEEGFIFVTVNDLLTRYGYSIDMSIPHTAQYAVYETNSPYAKKYLKEINEQETKKASSSAAGSFYTERSQIETNSDVNRKNNDSDSIRIITSDKDKKRLVY